jgi:tetratricopeptide (TPR) repeat protein
LLWLLLVGSVDAAEQTKAFLTALRNLQYYDTALDYLETMRNSPLADKDFKDTVDFEIGVTLLESTKLLPLVDREKRLTEAKAAFQKFITDHSSHWLTIEASAHLGNLLVERGRVKQAMAERLKQTPKQKQQLLTEARALYRDAQQLYTIIETDLSERLKQFHQIDQNDTQKVNQRNQLRSDIMQVRLALATVIYEGAKTYDSGSKDNKERLEEAAKKFFEYNKKYSRWVGGYYAKVNEARCYQELGDYNKAFDILNEVINKKEFEEGFHRVRSTATVLAIQIAMMPQVKKYKEALDIFFNWEKNVAKRGESTDEALAIKYQSGEAALEFARSFKVDSLESLKQRNHYLQLAKELFTFTTRFSGEYRRKARLKLADPLLRGNKSQGDKPLDYDEARDQAIIAWDALRERDLTADQEQKLREEALQKFRFALSHAPSGAKIEDLNDIRYRLGYLYWSAEEYYDSAVIGDFLARHFPNRPEAQQAAKLALASYLKILGDGAVGDEFQAEKSRMMEIARFITDRWPNSPAADEAWNLLIRVAMNNHELGKTVEYLNHVSADSPRRGEIELLTGKTLWTAYLVAQRQPKEKRLPPNELKELFSQARKALDDGVTRERRPVDVGGAVTPALAAAVLSLAQACLEANEFDKAISWLDDPQIGPHILISEKHRYVTQGNFRVETLKATLRAYVGALVLENIEEPMIALERIADGDLRLDEVKTSDFKLKKEDEKKSEGDKKPEGNVAPEVKPPEQKPAVEQTPEADKKPEEKLLAPPAEDAEKKADDGKKKPEIDINLTQVYRSLGLQLEQSLKRLREEKKTELVAKTSQGLALVLTHLTNRPTTDVDFQTLNWAAERFVDLAANVEFTGKQLPVEAADNYRKAVKAYDGIVEACLVDPKYAPDPKAVFAVQIRMARCLRHVGEYSKAVDVLIDVLTAQNNSLEAQREAAYTYQAWGDEKPAAYVFAIKGGSPVKLKDGKIASAIWGWGGIAKMVQANEKLEGFYHEARYNLALCRFLHGMSRSGQERTNLLRQAQRDMMYVYVQFPEMGGKQRLAQYDALLRKIQRLLGERENGIKVFDEPSAKKVQVTGRNP